MGDLRLVQGEVQQPGQAPGAGHSDHRRGLGSGVKTIGADWEASSTSSDNEHG